MSERLSETVTKIDPWGDLDAAIIARYGDTGRGRVGKLTILPTRQYLILKAQADSAVWQRSKVLGQMRRAYFLHCLWRWIRGKPVWWPWDYDKSLDDVPF